MNAIRFVLILLTVMLCRLPGIAREGLSSYQIFEEYAGRSIAELYRQGETYFQTQKPDSAAMLFTMIVTQEGKKLSDSDLDMVVRARNYLGVINFSSANYAAAYNHFMRSVHLNDVGDAAGYHNLAAIYIYYGDRPRAFQQLKKVFLYALTHKHSHAASMALINILNTDFEAIDVPVDSVRELIEKHDAMASDLPTGSYTVAESLSKAYIMSHEGHYGDAVAALRPVLGNLGRMLLPARDIHGVYMKLADQFSHLGEKDSTLVYLNKAEYIAEANGFKELLADTYRRKAVFYMEQGNKERAKNCRMKALEITDSLFNPKELGKIRDLEMNYEVSRFESEMEIMKVKDRLRIILIWVLVGVLLLTVGFIIIMIGKNRELRRKNRSLFERNLQEMKIAKQEEQKSCEETAARIDDEALLTETSVTIKETEEYGSDELSPLPVVNTDIDDTSVMTIPVENEQSRYPGSNLSDTTRRRILARIKDIFAQEDIYTHEGFNLQELARLCGSNSNYVSQVINQDMGMSFSQLLNERRIDLARRRLIDPANQSLLTIEGIASELGFKSRTTFSKTFKRITGLSPVEFQRMARDSIR